MSRRHLTQQELFNQPVKGKRTRQTISEQTKDRVVELYQQNETLQSIADRCRMCLWSVKDIINKRGIEHRGPRITYITNHDFFRDIDTEHKAYILGLMATDGWITQDKRQVNLSFKAADKDFLESVRDAMSCTAPIATYRRYINATGREYFAVQLSLCSEQMAADLISHGVHPRKTKTVDFWDGPIGLMPHYVRGLLDGDGSIFKQRRGGTDRQSINFCGNELMAKGFIKHVRSSIGVDPGCHEIRHNRKTGYATHRVYYHAIATVQAICRYIYADATLYMPRKKARADIALAHIPRTEGGYMDHSHITAEQLSRLRSVLPSWYAVARHLGINIHSIGHVRRKVGLL